MPYEYKLRTYDLRYPDSKAGFDADCSAENEWVHANSQLSWPYIYVLWQRRVDGNGKQDPLDVAEEEMVSGHVGGALEKLAEVRSGGSKLRWTSR